MESQFAFIVHSRDRSDLPRKFPWLKFMPKRLFDLITLHTPPFVVSRITGLTGSDGASIGGLVLGIPMTAHQLLEHREKARQRIIQAVKLAQSKGVRYIGLGAMTASLSKGGRDVIEQVNDVYVTTGRTYTVINITGYIESCVARFDLDKNKIRIGIVGAAGGIGSGVAISLARKQYRNFLLIDLERKLSHLEGRIEALEKHAPDLTIDISHRVEDVSSCDIIVAATSSPEIVIESGDVKAGAIIINDAQPSDISPEIVKDRPDVLVIEGGVLQAKGMNCHFNFGLAHKDDVFSCLAETLLLAYMDSQDHYSVDDFDPALYSKLEGMASKLGFEPCMQNDVGIIDERRLRQFATIRAREHAS